MSFRSLIAATVLTAGLGLSATAQSFPILPTQDGTGIKVEDAAFRCGPGWTRGPYGHCRPKFTCPPGYHSGPHGFHCFPNRMHHWR